MVVVIALAAYFRKITGSCCLWLLNQEGYLYLALLALCLLLLLSFWWGIAVFLKPFFTTAKTTQPNTQQTLKTKKAHPGFPETGSAIALSQCRGGEWCCVSLNRWIPSLFPMPARGCVSWDKRAFLYYLQPTTWWQACLVPCGNLRWEILALKFLGFFFFVKLESFRLTNGLWSDSCQPTYLLNRQLV